MSDRFDRRRVLSAADLIARLAVAAMGVLSLNGTLELWHLMVLARALRRRDRVLRSGVRRDRARPGRRAICSSQANSLDQFVRPAAWRLAGPASAGSSSRGAPAARSWSTPRTFGGLDRGAAAHEPAPHRRARWSRAAVRDAEIREGFRFVRARVLALGNAARRVVRLPAVHRPAGGPAAAAREERSGAATRRASGFILAMGGVGAIGAALCHGAARRPRRFITFMYVAWTSRRSRSRATGWRTSRGRR